MCSSINYGKLKVTHGANAYAGCWVAEYPSNLDTEKLKEYTLRPVLKLQERLRYIIKMKASD